MPDIPKKSAAKAAQEKTKRNRAAKKVTDADPELVTPEVASKEPKTALTMELDANTDAVTRRELHVALVRIRFQSRQIFLTTCDSALTGSTSRDWESKLGKHPTLIR